MGRRRRVFAPSLLEIVVPGKYCVQLNKINYIKSLTTLEKIKWMTLRLSIVHKYILYTSISVVIPILAWYEIKSYSNALAVYTFLRNCSRFCNNSSLHFEKL